MKVAIIGSTGQLGADLVKVFSDRHEVIALTHRDIEVENMASCRLIEEKRPDAVINTAAFHRTDDCEVYPERAFQVNAVGAKNTAEVCSRIKAVCIYISTDYVFDGRKGAPYDEYDQPNPINAYGVSKLAGELFTRNYCEKHYVVRVASLFGVAGASGKGGNFVETMIGKAKTGDELRVVDDVIMSPTYTRDAASAIRHLLEEEADYGVYHVTNSGYCSWFEFAKAIFELLELDVSLKPIKSSDLSSKARRPKFSALTSIRGVKLRMWKEALKEYLKEKGHLKER
ncbi:MAG: dTDP-4-dehydrorhamnose reductase [Candidatus Jordarchaeales archaeon]|nr:dTDP-4-dehydrorhamnose reductase [Candidatus Jordarchaeia archaeon]